MAIHYPTLSSEPPLAHAPDAIDIVGHYIIARAGEWRRERRGTLTIGLCGAQGSGKSTVSAAVAARLERGGHTVALLSLDDLYIAREGRLALAAAVHPLLVTRGVPGTHDVMLGTSVLVDLATEKTTAMPRFDKALDTIEPKENWPLLSGPVDVILFEGWCVGARPEIAGKLDRPINALERLEDPTGQWRCYVNDSLADAYQGLFARLDCLVLLAAPNFEVVVRWRQQQEHQLRARLVNQGRGLERTMDDVEIERFVQHYERLTRHILTEMPSRADLLIRLDESRRIVR